MAMFLTMYRLNSWFKSIQLMIVRWSVSIVISKAEEVSLSYGAKKQILNGALK